MYWELVLRQLLLSLRYGKVLMAVCAPASSCMRIAQIVTSLEIGGLERLAVDLAVEQKLAGHSPAIICIARRGPLADEAARQGVPVFVLNKPNGFSPHTVWRLLTLLRRLRADVVHTHNSLVHHYGAVAAKLAGIRAVVNTQHGIGSLQVDHRLARIFRLTTSLTKSIVFVSDETRRCYLQGGGIPEHKTTTIKNGISLARLGDLRARPGSRFPQIVFGTVGRLVAAKNHLGLIDAFAQVKRVLPSAELRIAGDGPLRGEIEDRIRSLDLAAFVQLHGQVLDVPRYLSELDVFVLCSLTEAMPIAILEAMAVGLPIVTSRVGGVPEIAPETTVAEYCPPGDARALAQAMLTLSNPDRMRCMGSFAARHAKSSLSLQRTWRAYEQHFTSLLAACGPKGQE